MPSLRKRVTSYFRQLSFHNESREKRHNINENSFVTKYLQGHIVLQEGPPIIYGKNPTDLPNYELGCYQTGPNTVRGCYSGPNGGLTTVKRTEKHLSILDPDIDFIDTHDDDNDEVPPVSKTIAKNLRQTGQPIDNTTMIIKVAGHEYCVTNRPKRHSKSHSLGSIADFGIEIEKTKIDKSFYTNYNNNNNSEIVECKNFGSNNQSSSSCKKKIDTTTKNNCSSVSTEMKTDKVVDGVEANRPPKAQHGHNDNRRQKPIEKNSSSSSTRSDKSSNYGLSKSKSDGNPFHHKRKGRIIKVDRTNLRGKHIHNQI